MYSAMITCISIDDEPLAHKIIKAYCDRLDFLQVVEAFKGAVDALGYLAHNEVDLIFLDINMPVLKGLDFLRTLRNPPMVIITSAHHEYALEGYELDVIDYLLKPFGFERFLKAVNKAGELKKLKASQNHAPMVADTSSTPVAPTTPAISSHAPSSTGRIFVKSDKKTHQINLSDILFLESAGSYVKIHLEDEMIMVLDRLGNFENTLPKADFVRVHKSYIVAIPKIKTIEGNRIYIAGTPIPVGQVYKVNLKRLLE